MQKKKGRRRKSKRRERKRNMRKEKGEKRKKDMEANLPWYIGQIEKGVSKQERQDD